MTPKTDRTREWARIGASARLQEIEAERAAILKEFPALRSARGRVVVSKGLPRRRLTAAARKKLSAGMRKYWARRKAQAASKG
jgi:hypothetical protein